MYKKLIDPSSLRFVSMCEWVPGRMQKEERYIDGVLVETSVRSITPVFELGSACDPHQKRLTYDYWPVEVECVLCGWKGLNKDLEFVDNGEEAYETVYGGEDDYETENPDYKCSYQVCPSCKSWSCLGSAFGVDIEIYGENIHEFKQRFGIIEEITEENLNIIKERITNV